MYDYNHKTYKNSKTPIEIICKKHGSFKQTPDSHINGKHGCPDCSDEEISERLKLDYKELQNRFNDKSSKNNTFIEFDT